MMDEGMLLSDEEIEAILTEWSKDDASKLLAFRRSYLEVVKVCLVAQLAKATRNMPMDEEPICECGDFQISHENGTGKCFICAWNPVIRGEPCQEFKEVTNG